MRRRLLLLALMAGLASAFQRAFGASRATGAGKGSRLFAAAATVAPVDVRAKCTCKWD